jgi:hypothetical protein
MVHALLKRRSSVCCLLLNAMILVAGACGADTDSAGSAQPQGSGRTAKIMPLGDSITESSKGLPSYRYYLWHLAVDTGYRIDFVGSLHGVGNGPPANPDFDMDHEGHTGFRADQIRANVRTWATAASPDIVLLHIGTNDFCQEQSVESTVSDVEGIIDVLRAVSPRVEILLAQIIAASCNGSNPAFNARLPDMAARKTSPESPIVLVDQYTGFDPSTMTYDGIHPTAVGESRMADRWFEQLAPLLDAFGAPS